MKEEMWHILYFDTPRVMMKVTQPIWGNSFAVKVKPISLLANNSRVKYLCKSKIPSPFQHFYKAIHSNIFYHELKPKKDLISATKSLYKPWWIPTMQ